MSVVEFFRQKVIRARNKQKIRAQEISKNAEIIKCVCGSNIKNYQKNITDHNKSQKHIMFVNKQIVISINCECGGKMKNCPKDIERHNKTGKHIIFMKTKIE